MIQDENQIKLGGVFLPGLIRNMEVKSSAKIEEQEVEGSAVKPKQAVGYEDVKINIELLLDDDFSGKSKEDKLKVIQDLYRLSQQKVPKPLEIIEPFLALVHVSTVLFKSFSYRFSNKKDNILVSMELWQYIPMTIPVRKKGKKTNNSGKTSEEKDINLKENYQDYLAQKKGIAVVKKTDLSPFKEKEVDLKNYKMKMTDYADSMKKIPKTFDLSQKPKFEGNYEIR